MATRFVEKSSLVRTAEDAERYVFEDSGRVVFPTGETTEVNGGFSVTCFSLDGRPRAMERSDALLPGAKLPGQSQRQFFKVIVVSRDEKTAVVSDGSTGLELIVPRTLPQFYGGEVRLEPGQTFSGVLHGQNQIVDALNEDNVLVGSPAVEVLEQADSWAPYSNPPKPAGQE